MMDVVSDSIEHKWMAGGFQSGIKQVNVSSSYISSLLGTLKTPCFLSVK